MATIPITHPVYLVNCASIAGQKELEGPFGHSFDEAYDNDQFGEKNWDEAESFLQKRAVETVLQKSGLTSNEISFCFAGDLLEECTASSFGLKEFGIPHFGTYGACSTLGESLILASMCLNASYAHYILAVTSSHFASAEVAFRFPLHYGNQRPLSSTRTVTGGGAFLLSGSPKDAPGAFCKVTSVTPGRLTDYGITDSMNMGAAMAPAACDTLTRHFRETNTTCHDYDVIVTGDLGVIGQKALKDLLKKEGFLLTNTLDCGRMIYGVSEDFKECLRKENGDLSNVHEQASNLDTNAGGSGCGCSALMLAAYFLPKLKKKELHKILFMPTGAMLSKISFQEGRTIPSIAHAVVLEAL